MGGGTYLKEYHIAAIGALFKAGHSVNFITGQTNIAKRTVQRWVSKFRQNPDSEIVLHKSKPGRPRRTVPRTLNIFKRQVDADPTLTARQIKEINPLLLGKVGVRTIQRRLKLDLGYRRTVAKKRPAITAKQKDKRLKFALENLKKYKKKWRKTLFSDESSFVVCGNSPKWVRRRPGSDRYDPKFINPTVKQPQKLMIWGCISYSGPGSLVFLPKNTTMNSVRYRQLLRNNLKESLRKCKIAKKDAVFQQDGATPHTAKIIGTYLDSINISYIKPWPGNSPDLNPIEHVWSHMKMELQNRDTSSIPKLEAEIWDIWQHLDRNYIKDLIDSVPNRLQEVIDCNGRATSY